MAHILSIHMSLSLLISQLDSTINGQPVDARIRRNKGKSGDAVLWPDSSADDYIHHPVHEDTKNLCSYAYFSRFQKECKTFKEMNSNKKQENIIPKRKSVQHKRT